MRLRAAIMLLALIVGAKADESSLKIKVSIVKGQVEVSVTNDSDSPEGFYDTFYGSSGDVPSFAWIKCKRANKTVIKDSNHARNGWFTPMSYSSFELDWSRFPRKILQPGETFSYSERLGKFLHRAPWPYDFGFSWVKFKCRVYTTSRKDYVERETEWISVDYKEILKDAR